MKKIFILTGEPSGDKLAAEVIKELKKSELNIEYLSVGGQHLNSIHKYSIFILDFFNSLITSEANLSPEGSPVKIKIFFI